MIHLLVKECSCSSRSEAKQREEGIAITIRPCMPIILSRAKVAETASGKGELDVEAFWFPSVKK